MSRRYGQSGYVVKKGNSWHGRFYVDLQDRRKRMSVPLGKIDKLTKPEANQPSYPIECSDLPSLILDRYGRLDEGVLFSTFESC